MGTMTIGRVGLDVVMDDPTEWRQSRSVGNREFVVRGNLRASTLADTAYLRRELIEQQGELIACTYSGDSYFNAFYYLRDVTIESIPVSYMGAGIFPFELILARIGQESRVELQSLITQGDIANDHGTVAEPFHAPPIGHLAYDASPGSPGEITRTGADGAMAVYTEISGDSDPAWAVLPSGFYDGAVSIVNDSKVIAGYDMENDPTSWELQNGFVRIRPTLFGSTSDGRFTVEIHNGTSWGTATKFKILYTATFVIPQWHYVTVLKNTPEVCAVRLVRDAATVPASAKRHTLDITLRRGSRFASFLYSYSVAGTHLIGFNSATTVTRPGGASYVQASSLVSGDRFLIGAPKDYTESLGNGTLTMDVSATTMPFWIGAAVGDASSGSDDGPADLAKQYVGWVSETVRAVLR